MDHRPADYFFAFRKPTGGFGSWCKKCMGSGLTGSSHPNGLGMVFILQCKKCKITKSIQVTPEDMELNYRLGKVYERLVEKSHYRG